MKKPTTQFEKGKPKTGGRGKGTRNKFSKRFDDDLRKDYLKHGAKLFETMRIEKPVEYAKLIAARFPQPEGGNEAGAQIVRVLWGDGTPVAQFARGTRDQLDRIERTIVDRTTPGFDPAAPSCEIVPNEPPMIEAKAEEMHDASEPRSINNLSHFNRQLTYTDKGKL